MTEPARTPLVTIATTDLCAITRGRSISAASLKETATRGVGWVPANSSLTPFDIIADPNPWGSQGDLRLLPDLAARYRVASSRAPTPFDLVMADIVELDGRPGRAVPARSSSARSQTSRPRRASRSSRHSNRNSRSSARRGVQLQPFLCRRCDDAIRLRRSSCRRSMRRGSNPKCFCPSTAATSSRSAAARRWARPPPIARRPCARL